MRVSGDEGAEGVGWSVVFPEGMGVSDLWFSEGLAMAWRKSLSVREKVGAVCSSSVDFGLRGAGDGGAECRLGSAELSDLM